MATYAVGDLQGCFLSFTALLEKIKFSPQNDCIWLVGDIVNRGAHSLECLEWVMTHPAQMVLGNHDLFLLACAHGFKTPKKTDTLTPILNSPRLPHFVDFLKKQPLLFEENGFCMIHAGILPQWTLNEARGRARRAEKELQHNPLFLKAVWDDSDEQHFLDERLTINVFTRMRFLKPNGELDLDFKGEIENAPEDLIPWFTKPRTDSCTFITGHWSALGLKITPRWMALDSGCLWGRELTAVRLEDRAVFQVPRQEK